MKAFILAAGKGERMRPLTNDLPKVLLCAHGKPLIVYMLEALREAGIREFVINTAYLGHKVQDALGKGHSFGVEITYSEESEPLETAGAIYNARSLLGGDAFVLVNGDVWTDFDFTTWLASDDIAHLCSESAHLLLVNNPAHNSNGDFSLRNGNVVLPNDTLPSYTFAGISAMSPALFDAYPHKKNAKLPLRDILRWGLERGSVKGTLYEGAWIDVGTPERLAMLEQKLA